MKNIVKKSVLIVLFLSLLITSVVYANGLDKGEINLRVIEETRAAKEPLSNGEIKERSETQPIEETVTETKIDMDSINEIIEVRYCFRPEPDYERQLWESDDVIFGEVIEELEGRYSNPNGEIEEIGNDWITTYAVRVDKSYKGLLTEGETVIVNTWNEFSPEEKKNYKENGILIIGDEEFYLHKGQRGIFMLEQTQHMTTENNEPLYHIVMEKQGIFEAKETDSTLITENEKTIYSSSCFEITLDQIADDIKKADEIYKNEDKRSPNNI